MSHRLVFIRSLVIILIATVLGWASSFLVTPVHQAEFSAIVLRPSYEFSDFKPEQNFNRWVWARDGLAIQEGLLTDDFLIGALRSIPELAAGTKSQAVGAEVSTISSHALSSIRAKTEILFGGAESQLFTMRFKHTSSIAAVKFAELTRNHMRDYVRSNTLGHLESAIKDIDQKIKSSNASAAQLLIRMHDQLHSQLTIQTADFDRQFRVIKQPQLLPAPIWPKPKLLAALGLLFGLFGVVAVEVIRRLNGAAR
jgi:hypothetical protein